MPLLSSYSDRTLTRVLGHDSGLLVGKARIRELLTAARTYYVRSDGTDAGTGLVNASSASAPNCAKLTFAGALSAVCGLIDFGGQTVTISMQNTTWTTFLDVNTPWTGGGALIIDGGGGTISTTSDSCLVAETNIPSTITIQNVTLTSSGNSGVSHYGTGQVVIGSGVVFGACANAHMECTANGADILVDTGTNYSITGGGTYHCSAFGSGSRISLFGNTVTITGTPNFTGGGLTPAFIYSDGSAFIESGGTTWSGAVNAAVRRYYADYNGVIQVYGAGTTYFPGSVAGATATGGQYAP